MNPVHVEWGLLLDTEPLPSQLQNQGAEQGSAVLLLLLPPRFRDGYVSSWSFILQEGELLRISELIPSGVVVIRSWVSLICCGSFLYTGAGNIFQWVESPM